MSTKISLIQYLKAKYFILFAKLTLIVSAFPGLCACCPIKPMSSLGNSLLPLSDPGASSPGGDQRSSSVAELRRKAQEHSAALLHSLHSFQQAAGLAAGAGLNFPLLPPLTLHALQRKQEETSSKEQV